MGKKDRIIQELKEEIETLNTVVSSNERVIELLRRERNDALDALYTRSTYTRRHSGTLD